MNSSEYWLDRSTKRLVASEKLGNKTMAAVSDIYDQALRNIDKDIAKIYDKFSKDNILDPGVLNAVLNKGEQSDFFKSIRDSMERLNIDPATFSDRYAYRLTRLEALKAKIKLEVASLAPKEIKATGTTYAKVAKEGYAKIQDDLEARGVNVSFATLDDRMVGEIMKNDWKGKNYSTRIWGNTDQLAGELPNIIGGALVSGQSYQKTARLLRDQFGVGKADAARLARTEINYFHNQIELQSYADDGIDSYEFNLALEHHIGDECDAQDGKVYKITEAVVGENYPPLHPNCRCSTSVSFSTQKASSTEPVDQQDRVSIINDSKPSDKWQQVMQKQMNPNQEGHDWNADMNRLTQTYTGKELQNQIQDLMQKVPSDYPLKGALETIAKINGVREDANINNNLMTVYRGGEIGKSDYGNAVYFADKESVAKYYAGVKGKVNKFIIDTTDFIKLTKKDEISGFSPGSRALHRIGLSFKDIPQDLADKYTKTGLNFMDNAAFDLLKSKGYKGIVDIRQIINTDLTEPTRQVIVFDKKDLNSIQNDKTPSYDEVSLKNVNIALKKNKLDDLGLDFSAREARFINDHEIKLANVRSATDDIGGVFNKETSTISIDKVNLNNFAKQLGQPNYANMVIQHELGHAFDASVPQSEYSTSEAFNKALSKEDRYAISKQRFANGVENLHLREYFDKLSVGAYEQMANTGETIKFESQDVKVPKQQVDYHLQNDELFAEGYSLFYTNPKWLSENAPSVYKYFNSIITVK